MLGATIPHQSGPESHANEGVLCIPQSSSITGTWLWDCLVSYAGHSLGGLTSLRRCNRGILQPEPTGKYIELNVKTVLFPIIQFCISTQFTSQNSSI